jgi:hypothetical protein
VLVTASPQAWVCCGGRIDSEVLLFTCRLAGQAIGPLGYLDGNVAMMVDTADDFDAVLRAGGLVVSVSGDFAMSLCAGELEVVRLTRWLWLGARGGLA